MAAKVFLSCSRMCEEKDILKNKILQSYDIYETYDCEDRSTTLSELTKQGEINEFEIANSSWFILLCPIGWVGEHTKEEFCAALKHQKKNGYPIISIVNCSNASLRRKFSGIPDNKPDNSFSVEDLLNIAKAEYCRDNEDYLLEYSFINDKGMEFDNFKVVLLSEVNKFDNECTSFFLRTTTPSLLTPSHFFYDKERILEENGFNSDKYISTEIDRKIAEKLVGNTLVVVHGRPASGKSRAVYQYLKSIRDKRIYVIKDSNELSGVIRYVNENIKNLSLYSKCPVIIACDQINTLLRLNDDSHQYIRRFFKNLEDLKWKFVATCTEEGYNKVCEIVSNTVDFAWDGVAVLPITQFLFGELKQSGLVSDKTHFKENMVIGECLSKFADYQNSIFKNIDDIDVKCRMLFADFFKAIQIVETFRHYDQLPLCLVVMMMYHKYTIENSESADFKSLFLSLMTSLTSTMSIISLKFDSSANDIVSSRPNPFALDSVESTLMTAAPVINELAYDKLQEYDNEKMITLVDPKIIIEVKNEYVYEKVINGESLCFNSNLNLDFNDWNVREQAMEWFYGTFSVHHPVSTLKRILLRNPVTYFKNRYDSNLQQNLVFVMNKLQGHFFADDTKADENLNDLISLCIGRSNSYSEISKRLHDFSAYPDKFVPNYVTAGEILGAAARRNDGQRKSLIDLANDILDKCKGEHKGIKPAYILQRELNFFTTVESSFDYIQSNLASFEEAEKVLTALADKSDEKKRLEYNLSMIKNQLIDRISKLDDLEKVISYLELKGEEYINIVKLVNHSNNFFDWSLRQKYLERVWQYLTNNDSRCNVIFRDKFVAILYIMIVNTRQYIQAKDLLNKGLDYAIKNNITVSDLEISKLRNACCGQCRNFEHLILYNDYFQNGKLKEEYKDISLILRNSILKSAPTFTDSISLLPKLYDGVNYVPDAYTVAAVSAMEYKNSKKKSRNKDVKNNNDITFENILEIFYLPIFDTVDFGEYKLFNTFLSCCYTREHLAELKRLMQERKNMKKHSVDWDTLLQIPEIASSLINRNILSIKEAWGYLKNSIKTCYKNEIVPDPINAYAKFLSENTDDADFVMYREKLETEVIKPYYTRIFKDSFFYSAYFRLYPKEIFSANGKFEVSERLVSIDSALFDGRIVTATLLGALEISSDVEICRKAFESIQKWWIDNYPDIYANSLILKNVREKLGDNYKVRIKHTKNYQGKKNKSKDTSEYVNVFSLTHYSEQGVTPEENIETLRQDLNNITSANQFPTVSSLHQILINEKNNQKYTPEQLLEILKIVFIDRGYQVLPSIVTSFLFGVYNYIRYENKNVTFSIKAFKAMKLIMDSGILEQVPIDNMILARLIDICPGNYRHEGKDMLDDMLNKVEKFPFKGHTVLSILINKGLNNVFMLKNNFTQTVGYILQYVNISTILSEPIGESAAIYLRAILTHFKHIHAYNHKESALAIFLLLDSLEKNNIVWLKKELGKKGDVFKMEAIQKLSALSGQLDNNDQKMIFNEKLGAIGA